VPERLERERLSLGARKADAPADATGGAGGTAPQRRLEAGGSEQPEVGAGVASAWDAAAQNGAAAEGATAGGLAAAGGLAVEKVGTAAQNGAAAGGTALAEVAAAAT
jgi:hypothetical protein